MSDSVYLLIQPLCAKLLRTADTLDVIASYCEISIGNQSKHTQNAEIALKFPSWNEKLIFRHNTQNISIKLWDIKRNSQKFLFGETILNGSDVESLNEN